MDNAFTHYETKAADLESDYSYRAINGVCAESSNTGQVLVTKFVDVEANNQAQLAAALQQQPVSVAIQANRPVFQSYTSGIFNSEKCGTRLDHGVVAVGYGSENGVDYFIVRNSWSSSWGEQGYIRIARDDSIPEGICGIAMQASYPEVTKAWVLLSLTSLNLIKTYL